MSTAVGAIEAAPMIEVPAAASVAAAAAADTAAPADAQDAEGVYSMGWTEYVMVALIALVVSAAVFGAGWFVFARPAAVKLGVVDLPSIVEIEELSLTASMMGSQVTDADRANAYERVKGFGPKLEAAIDQARKECGCILLTRNALVGQSADDQTARVKQILGVGSVNAAELREKIAKSVQAIPESGKR